MSEDWAPRVDRLESRVERVERDISDIRSEQAETRVYVRQIFDRIDDLKTMISAGGKSQSQWIDFVKWIIGGTIFIIVAYLFGTAGGG